MAIANRSKLDLEMAFRAEKDVMLVIEQLLTRLWADCINVEVPAPFQRMTYQEAMASYGSDKPDLRFGMEVYFHPSQFHHHSANFLLDTHDYRKSATVPYQHDDRPRESRH